MTTAYNLRNALYRGAAAKRQEILDPGSGGTVKVTPFESATLTIATAGTRTLEDPTGLPLALSLSVFSTIAAAVVSASSVTYTLNAGDYATFRVVYNSSGTKVWVSSAVSSNLAYDVANGIRQGSVTAIAGTTTATITPAQMLTGVLSIVPTNSCTYTFPTAALLVAAITNPNVGDIIDCICVNNNSGQTGTLAAGANGTLIGATGVATNTGRKLRFVLTNVTLTTETYTMISV